MGLGWGEVVALPDHDIERAGRLCCPAGEGPFSAIVMLHGCSGLWTPSGEPTASFAFWVEHFRDRAYVTLLADSFVLRREREICTQASRKVSEAADRPRNAHAALRRLASRKDVDSRRIHLMGWSNGGSAALHALRPDAPGRAIDGPQFRSAVVSCPGCAAPRWASTRRRARGPSKGSPAGLTARAVEAEVPRGTSLGRAGLFP